MSSERGTLFRSFALLLALPFGGRAGETPSAAALQRVSAVLQDVKDPAETADRLVGLGTVDVPAIFESYRLASEPPRRTSAGNEADDSSMLPLEPPPAAVSAEVPGSACAPSSTAPAPAELRRQALLAALKRTPQAWHGLCEELAHETEAWSARSAAVRALAEIGSAADVALMLELASPREGSPAERSEVRVHFARLLEREPSAFAELEQRFPSASPALQPELVQALSKAGSPLGLAVLARLLGKDSELDLLLLCAIERCAGASEPPYDAHVGDSVRARLASTSTDVVREAALALGKLEDSESAAELVVLLAHQNRGVRWNAHWALQRITGLGFSSDPRAWGAWLSVEESWWKQAAPRLFARLERAQRPEAVSILQEVARRRFPRHLLAAELARATLHPDAQVRRLACSALAPLRSRAALPALLRCLEDPETGVRDAAGHALCAITGLRLPAARAAWKEAGY